MAHEWICSVVEVRRIDDFLCYLVEVAAHTLDGGPLRGPFTQVTPLMLRSDNRLEMFEDKKELRQLFERFVVIAERGTMAVRGKETIAPSMNSRDLEFGEVSPIADLASRSSHAITQLEGGLLCKGAEHEFTGSCLAEDEQIHGPQYQAKSLARARASDDQQWPIAMADDGALRLIQGGIGVQKGESDTHNRPSWRKLKA